MDETIPESVRRFVLTSIPTVPHLEALLILWREQDRSWRVERLASRLYVQPSVAQSLLDDLCRADLLDCDGDPREYRTRSKPDSLRDMIALVDTTYSTRLRAVTDLIHSNVDRKAARFAQAFSWRKR